MHSGNFYRHGGGVELNLSISRKYALGLGQFLSEVGEKVRDTQYCKLGGQGLKKLLCPLGA